jgi:predicted amidohydrolase YtcJ
MKYQLIPLIVIPLFVLFSVTEAQESADLILYNGTIWTVEPENPQAEAVAIHRDKFMAIGSNESVLKLAGKQTRKIDLKKALVVPGFNDNHVHFSSAARFLEFNIMKATTQSEFVDRIKDLLATLPKGEWITGGFWGAYDQWAAGSAGLERRQPFTPDLSLISEITQNYPVFIRKFDDSEFAANEAALKASGIDPQNRVKEGIEFLRDSNGKFTGILKGKGVAQLFDSVVPKKFSHQRRVNQTKKALAEIAKHGVCNISDMSDDEQLDIYRELHQKNELTVRVHFRYPLDRWTELSAKNIHVGTGDEWIRLGSLKGHIDGIMGTSTARFFQPYSNDPNNRGRWRPLMVNESGNFVEGKFLKYMLDADKADLQLTVHAIGDEANHLLLNYLEELRKVNGEKDRRFRLVHAQVIAPDDFARLGPLKVVAEVQPFHLSDDMRWMEERIGKQRCQGAYAFKRIQNSGAILSFGTDWPGTSAAEYPINPMLGLYAAVSRQTTKGEPQNGWFPDERISIEDAIRAYTLNTAYANFEDNIKGSIRVGKFADLTVLSGNILKMNPTEILSTKVLYTIVGGKIVFQRD